MSGTEARNTAIFRQVVFSALSNYVGKFIALGTWFFLTPFILWQLGPTDYGLWTLTGSTVAYGTLLDFGIMGATIKYVAEYRARGELDKAHPLVATALSLYALLGLLAFALSAGFAAIFPVLFDIEATQRDTAVHLALVMGLGIGIAIPCLLPNAVLQGLQRYDLTNLFSTVSVLLSAVATAIVLLLGGGVVAMVAVSIPITLAIQVPSILAIRRIAPELRFGWRGAERKFARSIISYSASLFAIDLATRLQTKTDEIVIGAVLALSAVTPYTLARKLSELGQILVTQFLKVLLPLASGLHAEDDHDRLRTVYLAGTRVALAISLPVGTILIMLAGPILTLWVGTEYADSKQLVVVLTLAMLVGTSQWPAVYVLQGMARHRLLALVSMCSGIVNIILSITLARRFGVMGVAVGTLIPTTLESLGFTLPYILRTINVRMGDVVRQVFMPTLLPVIPMALTVYGLARILPPNSLFLLTILAGAGLLIYSLAYVLFGASTYERQAYRKMLTSVAMRVVRTMA